jgi:catechol 2,3-dioxygenase-like lactoylglutathione lyase family enzyme
MRPPQRGSLLERGLGEGAATLSTKSAQVVSVSVPVSDQEQAREFYVDTLGFELLVDNSWREGMHWIEVAPEGSATSLMLVSWSESLLPSLYRVIVITTDDIRVIYEELVAKGVFFDLPPTELSNGTQAMFRDPDGNALVFWEHSSSASRESAHRGSGSR